MGCTRFANLIDVVEVNGVHNSLLGTVAGVNKGVQNRKAQDQTSPRIDATAIQGSMARDLNTINGALVHTHQPNAANKCITRRFLHALRQHSRPATAGSCRTPSNPGSDGGEECSCKLADQGFARCVACPLLLVSCIKERR